LKNFEEPRKVNALKWFGIIVVYTALTLLCVYLIPITSPLNIITAVLGFVFVAFLPGYCLISFLFYEGKLDLPEKAVLSVALSFSIAGVSGLFLGLSSIGITGQSITESLGAIVLVLAVLAVLRKMNIFKFQLRKLRAQESQQLTA
jgi:uncharacterized membrane protein